MSRADSPFYVPRDAIDEIVEDITLRAASKKKLKARSFNPALGATAEEADATLEKIRGDIGLYGEYVFGLAPARVHQFWNQRVEDVIQRRIRQNKILILAPPNSAKALALDTPIPTPRGWTTMGELCVEDEVFGADGRPIRVLRKSEIFRDRPVYRVMTHCGEEIIADEDHLWYARLDRKSPYRQVTTKELAHPRNKAAQVPRMPGLDLPEVDLPIPPYLLGLWLGDGTSANGSITAHPKDWSWYHEKIRALGFEVTSGQLPMRFNVTGLIKLLREQNLLGNKHIPSRYLRASREQRIALLQGLIDTDGTVSPTTHAVTFCSTKWELADDTLELIRSLGIRAGMGVGRATLKGKDCGPVYRITFMFKDAASLPRKEQHCRASKKSPHTALRAEPAGRADTQCITVDAPDGLFLAGDAFTVTHNSTWNSLIRPSFHLGNHPEDNLLFMTSSDDMAKGFGTTVRTTLQESERHQEVFPDARCRPNPRRGWSGDGLYLRGTPISSKDPAYKAVGFGMSVMGARANGIILDDVLDQKQAESEIEQEKAINYYTKTVVPRLNTLNGWLLAVMTRFAEADLGGRLIKLAETSGDWMIVRTPMEAEDNDPMGRTPGELLWPEQFPPEFVAAVKKSMTIAEYGLVYQADPTGVSGDIFTSEQYFKPLPENFWQEIFVHPRSFTGQAVDLAFSKNKRTAFTVIMTYLVDQYFNMYLLHIDRARYQVKDSEERLKELIRITKPLITVIETENFHDATIRSMVLRIMHEVMCNIRLEKAVADKISRARLPAGRAEHGFMYIDKDAPWYRTFMTELLGFPNSTYKDQVDALSLAALTVQKMEEDYQRLKETQKPIPFETSMSA